MSKYLVIFGLLLSFVDAASDYEEWLKAEQNNYKTYKKSIDEEFVSSLRKDWEVYKGDFFQNSYEKPKPKEIPSIKLFPLDIPTQSKKVTLVPPKPQEQEPKEEGVVLQKFETPSKKEHQIITLDFYGLKLSFTVETRFKITQNIQSNSDIASVFEDLSKSDYGSLIEQINHIVSMHTLNDWGKYQLTFQIAQRLSQDAKKVQLLCWFLLLKSDYDVKVAMAQNGDVVVLGKFDTNLYQLPFFDFEKGGRYYVLSPLGRLQKVGSLFTYDANYPKKLKPLSVQILKPIKLGQTLYEKHLSFSYNQKKYSYEVSVNPNDIAFLKTYPQGEYSIYFDAQNPPYLDRLLSGLRNNIINMSEVEAVNFLLHFTQNAFAYQSDDEQFHYEKVMMPQETIFYPFSDCEDRSILFSFLIRNLLGLKIVGIKFSDHVATAIRLNTKIKADNFEYKNELYTIADPTYINANVGMMVPKYKNTQFEVIP